MTKTILLDLDGPLLDGALRHYQCYSDILKTHGYSPMSIADYWGMKRARKSRKEQLAVNGAEPIYDDFLREWLIRIEMLEYLALDAVQAGALSKLQEWSSKGADIILVTMRNNRENLMKQLKDIGVLSYLSSVIVCKHANGGEGKAREVLSKFPEINPFYCEWVGDTEADMEGARFLGSPVWLVSNGIREFNFLSSLKPEHLVESIASVDIEVT